MARNVDEAAREARRQPNMTPMIDVVFQIIIVFLCSMKFRTLDMKLEAHAAKQGQAIHFEPPEILPRVQVLLRRAVGETGTRVLLEDTRLGTAADDRDAPAWKTLEARLRAFREKDARLIGEIDAGPEVPHGDVVHCLDAFHGAEVADVRFRGTAGP